MVHQSHKIGCVWKPGFSHNLHDTYVIKTPHSYLYNFTLNYRILCGKIKGQRCTLFATSKGTSPVVQGVGRIAKCMMSPNLVN